MAALNPTAVGAREAAGKLGVAGGADCANEMPFLDDYAIRAVLFSGYVWGQDGPMFPDCLVTLRLTGPTFLTV